MRHRVVRRIACALALLCLAAAFTFAWHRSGARPSAAAGPAPPTEGAPGEAVFRRRCAACHAASDLAADLAARPDPGRAVAELLELLADHGGATPREDLDAAAWLLDLGSEPAAR